MVGIRRYTVALCCQNRDTRAPGGVPQYVDDDGRSTEKQTASGRDQAGSVTKSINRSMALIRGVSTSA